MSKPSGRRRGMGPGADSPCSGCGLRIGEALALKAKDFDPEAGTLVVQRGKGASAGGWGGCRDGGAGRPPAGATSLEGHLRAARCSRAVATATSPARTLSRWSRSGNAWFRRRSVDAKTADDQRANLGDPLEVAVSTCMTRARGGARSPRSGDPGSPCDATCRGGQRGPAAATVRARGDREAPQEVALGSARRSASSPASSAARRSACSTVARMVVAPRAERARSRALGRSRSSCVASCIHVNTRYMRLGAGPRSRPRPGTADYLSLFALRNASAICAAGFWST